MKTFTISLVGDIMLGGKFSTNYKEYYNSALPEEAINFLKSDFVLGNLEAPASNAGDPVKNKIVVYTKKEPLKLLKKYGFDFVNIANNHIMDYGYLGVEETKSILDKYDIKYSGCGKNLSEARKASILNKESLKVGCLSYTWTKEMLEPIESATENTAGVAPIEITYILEDIKKIKSENVLTLVAVFLHWGEDKSRYPRPEQKLFAKKIIDKGADLVIGQHAHCIQGYEIYRGKPIFYGVGNFISSQYMKDCDKKLNYEGRGKERIRYKRERKSAIFKLLYSDGELSEIRVMPLIQQFSDPIMKIDNPIRLLSLRFQNLIICSRLYKIILFPFFRRFDEISRIFEDLVEEGIKKEYFSLQTVKRVSKKLILGKHR